MRDGQDLIRHAQHFPPILRRCCFLQLAPGEAKTILAADKVLLDGIYVALAMGHWLPVWLVALVIGRDLLIVCGVALIRRRHATFRPKPLLIGKINTFAQILLTACALGHVGGWIDLDAAVEVLVVVVALTTLLSGAGYAGQAVRSIRLEQTS